MSRLAVADLADCSEFRQTLAAKPPRIVHGTALLLSCVLLSALGWAAITKANLVVLAQGRVRPETIPTRVFTPSSANYDGRVAAAPFDEGATIRQGDLLVRLDTSRIDNSIERVTRTIAAGEQELSNLTPQRELLASQCQTSEEKARRELHQAEEAVRLAHEKRASDIRQAQSDVAIATTNYERIQKLSDQNAATAQQVSEATAKLHQAEEQLVQAQLPVDDSAVAVARQAVELVSRDFAVRTADLETRIAAKQGEIDASGRDLANLTLERDACELRSPIDGVIVAGRVRAGDVLEPGKPVFELAQQATYCFEAAVPGADVGQLQVGMPVRIRFDAYDYQKYGALEGKVTYLSPDSRPLDQSAQT
ncbi:MAG: HlyD family efflux transporter periplasmic adaptor subunit, partial [Planctomycetaceae bacterium]|nr:HlyD family efflux transporter periplasmic adaptor subunit [Planctomycetaceae bacterium]